MASSVVKLSHEMVVPCSSTPARNLVLSFMDKTPGAVGLVDSIHVFAQGMKPAMVIKEALAKALFLYYPVAGKFVMSNDGELEICCSGDGVWFVEAATDGRLEDVNYLQLPLMMSKEDLLPYPSKEELDKLHGLVVMMIQVTQFSCGGFTIGLRSSHAMFDGLGVAQFLQAVGELARGNTSPTIMPIWHRDAIPSPPKPTLTKQLSSPPPLKSYNFEDFMLDIPNDTMNLIKDQFIKGTGKFCSKFDIITAMTWQSRARAIKLEPHASVRLGFAANVRHLVKHWLPKDVGYYGNCAYPMTVNAPCDKITNASLIEVISVLRDAKERLPTKFSKWLLGDPQGDPFKEPLDYGFLSVSDWSRVGLSEVNYGWGEPIYVCPLNDFNFIASCIFLKPPTPKQGVRVITRCVVKEEFDAFKEQMIGFANYRELEVVSNAKLGMQLMVDHMKEISL